MREMEDNSVDLVLTDPWYGIDFNFNAKRSRKAGLAWGSNYFERNRDWPDTVGHDKPFDPSPFLHFKNIIIWGAQNFASKLPDNRGWLIWDKLGNKKPCAFGDCELAWTNINTSVRIYRQLWRGIVREGEENVANGPKLHPCQKPIGLMKWCLGFVPRANMVLDPFAGSSTTAIACERLGINWICIEKDRYWCDVSVKRIKREVAQPRFA